jgi:hypothetical protein
MKLILFSLLILFATTVAVTKTIEDKWKITHNGRQLLHTSKEDATRNKATIRLVDLKKTGLLEINYMEQEAQKGWKRTIAFTAGDEVLYEQHGNYFKLTNTFLYSLSKELGAVDIYTWSLPTDPKVAATVRVRRVHLGTIVFK